MLLDSDPSLAVGKSTLTELEVFRKTIVQVHDHYYDVRRFDAPRMLAAILAAFAEVSGGALTSDGTTLFATAGGRWKSTPPPDSIWQVPLALRDLAEFLVAHLPPQHRLVKGAFAEILATNALLSTLDAGSMLLPSGVLSALRDRPMNIAGEQMQKQADAFVAAGFASAILPGGALHVRVGPFQEKTPLLIREALERAPANGGAGVILDLRGNLGGLYQSVEQVIDLFLSSGTMLISNFQRSAEVRSAKDDGLASEHVKLVVLVDSMTSSGAEMAAGALRFGDRAILVGKRTHGDGLIQVQYGFQDSRSKDPSVLRLTIAEAILPGNQVFAGIGIAPDLEVTTAAEHGPVTAEACSPAGITLVTIRQSAGTADPALELAARILTTARTGARTDMLGAVRSVAASAPRANR